MQTECFAEKDLPGDLAAEIQELQHLAFPHETIFTAQRWWHAPLQPTDRWFVAKHEGRLVGSVRVIERTMLADGRYLRTWGIGNVCSHPQARGLGAAKACMQALADQLAAGAAEFGVLMCGNAVHEFYARLGWRDVNNNITFVDPKGQRTVYPVMPGHFVMILPGGKSLEQWPKGDVDFNGEDW